MRLIDSFIEIHGNKMVNAAEPRHIRAILESMSRTPHQIASITGHQSLAEVERYTKGVRQRVVAEEAMQRLVGPEK